MNYQLGLPVDDGAYREALKVQEELRDRERALSRALDQVRADLKVVANFISLQQKLFSTPEPELVPVPESDSPKKRERNELPPAEIAQLAREALLEVGHPLKRGQLVRELEKRGVHLAGKDKAKNLGTILWRHEDQFENIPGQGYWPKER